MSFNVPWLLEIFALKAREAGGLVARRCSATVSAEISKSPEERYRLRRER